MKLQVGNKNQRSAQLYCIKILLGKSHHSAACLATPPGGYFRLTRPGFHLKELERAETPPSIGHCNKKRLQVLESPVKSDKNS